MFGLGISEIIIVIILCLVLINPRDLPRFARKAGKIYGFVMRQFNGVRKIYGQFENEVESISNFNTKDSTKKGE